MHVLIECALRFSYIISLPRPFFLTGSRISSTSTQYLCPIFFSSVLGDAKFIVPPFANSLFTSFNDPKDLRAPRHTRRHTFDLHSDSPLLPLFFSCVLSSRNSIKKSQPLFFGVPRWPSFPYDSGARFEFSDKLFFTDRNVLLYQCLTTPRLRLFCPSEHVEGVFFRLII